VHGENSRSRLRGFRRFCLAVILVLAAVALTGCDGAGDRPDDGPFEYVAVGDSFTATGLPEAKWPCKRSTQNYPQLIARAHSGWELVDSSCGGASSADMLESQEVRGTVQRPQFDALDEGTDLVTVSLGGNDFDVYWGFLYRCVQMAGVPDRDDAPCRTANDGRIERRMDEIRDNLAEVLEEAAARAPEARVLFVGYPRLLPDDGTCPKRIPVADGDVAYVREMLELLVAAQKGAAEDAGAEYVDVYSPSKGHDICSDDPWVNDATNGPQGSYNFHPMPAHQKAVAGLIEEML
jgi:lysophospholipase L1-like esterase